MIKTIIMSKMSGQGARQNYMKMERQWIVQRRISAVKNDYEDWPGYCERLLTRDEMLQAVKECEHKWPDHAFRGHNVVNQKPGSDKLRGVQ
jgi:hypothetical protein